MARQLNVRSDAAYETAHAIARRTRMTTTQVVEKALNRLDEETPKTASVLSPERQAWIDRLRAISSEIAKHKRPGDTSDHSDMYDENGLPI